MADSRREAARKIARFREIIAQRVNGECDEIMRDIVAARAVKLAEFRRSVESEREAWLAEQKRKAGVACTKSVSDKRLELRREFNSGREKLRESVFAEAQKLLREFAKSPEYAAWLEKRLEPYKDWEITYPEGGGFIAVNGGMRADESLERLLSEQRDWFLGVASADE